MAKKKWMQKAFGKNPGALHRALGVPEGEKIPASKLAKAAKSKNPLTRKRVALAKVGKRFGRKGGKNPFFGNALPFQFGDGERWFEDSHPMGAMFTKKKG
jgi:hypothetical protein